MRKTILLVCAASCLAACTPTGNLTYRSREDRPYPDPTQGTDNRESQWYKTQILASPSAPTAPTGDRAAGAPLINAPAKTSSTLAPTHKPSPATSEGLSTPAAPAQPQGF